MWNWIRRMLWLEPTSGGGYVPPGGSVCGAFSTAPSVTGTFSVTARVSGRFTVGGCGDC